MKNGNASPNSIAVGRKLMGGPGSSTHSMNHVYFNLKDDLIEHFDYEAVNHQVFQYLMAWYGVDI